MMPKIKLLIIPILILLVSCGAELKPPNLGELYTKSAQSAHKHNNPVIVIPGILGSKLIDKDSGRVVWGAFEKNYANPEKPEGARLIAIPMIKDKPLKELKDGVVSNGALDRVKVSFFGIPVELNAYFRILATLGAGGYKDESFQLEDIDYGMEHFTCFQFDYDWRRDNVENAKLLHDFILDRKRYVENELETRYRIKKDVKFDIVAHSMGGLVTRYFLRYGPEDLPEDGSMPNATWEGAKYVDMAIIIGTPNAGSANSLDNLINGKKLGFTLPTYHPAIIGTMPSVYQLLPRTRHKVVLDSKGDPIDLFNPEIWQKLGLGLINPNQEKVLEMLLPEISNSRERKSIAFDHLQKSLKRAKHFQEALDYPSNPPENLKLYLISGDAVPTNSVVQVDTNTGDLQITKQSPGDGTVTRYSALMDERQGNEWQPHLISPIKWAGVMFLFTDHLGLTKDPSFTDNVLYLLLEQPKL